LGSQLTGWDIDILTEAEESERRQEEFKQRSQMFIDFLDVDEVIAQLLVIEGFSTVEEVAYVPIEELMEIESFDQDIAEELHRRAETRIEEENARLEEHRRELGVTDELAAIEALSPAMLVVLGENDVKTLDDLGDLASDELMEFLPDVDFTIEEADAIIMAARAHWFDDDELPQNENGEAGEDEPVDEAEVESNAD
jgi:N utilization substance protein A